MQTLLVQVLFNHGTTGSGLVVVFTIVCCYPGTKVGQPGCLKYHWLFLFAVGEHYRFTRDHSTAAETLSMLLSVFTIG